MSGQWWESDLIVGPFANIIAANAWAAANPSSLFQGLLATSNGQQIKWGGAGVGWRVTGASKGRNTPTLLRNLSYYGSANSIAADRTIAVQIPADGDFSAVRLELHNYDTSPVTIGPVWVAAAANTLDIGSGLTWLQVFFGGNATITIPAATRTSLGGGVAYDIAYTVAKSDIAYIKSIPRADGSKFPLLHVRTYFLSGGVCDILDNTIDQYAAQFPSGKSYAAARVAGDLATSHAAITLSGSGATPGISPAAVEFFYVSRTLSVAEFGDSIQSGAAATDAQLYSPLGRAAKLLNASAGFTKYSFSAFSQSAQKHKTTLANMLSTVAKSAPCIVRIPTASPNDGAFTATQMELYWAYTMQMVEAAESVGIRYYLVGPTPSWGGTNTANLISYNERGKTWCAANAVPYIDAYSAVVDPSVPGSIAAAYDSGDHVHLNAVGYNLIATMDAAAITTIS